MNVNTNDYIIRLLVKIYYLHYYKIFVFQHDTSQIFNYYKEKLLGSLDVS